MQKFLLIALSACALTACTDSSPSRGELAMTSDSECFIAFWPPDMVPHPHPPQPDPKDDNMA